MKPKISIDELVKESAVNEAINAKDIKVGTILHFNDGETWKVTKTSGIASGKIFAAPHGDTKKNYVSLPIEFSIDKLEQDVKSLSESVVNEGIGTIALGIMLAWVGIKVLGAVTKKVLGNIASNIEISPDKLKQLTTEMAMKVEQETGTGRGLLLGSFLKLDLDKKIDSGNIKTVNDLNKAMEAYLTTNESVFNEAATFKTSDIAKTVSYLTAEVGVEPGYIFFGDGEDIEDFDKLWKKRKYQEALDMLANDREIVAKTFDDVKPWVKESVNEGFLDVNDGFWALYIANKDTTIGKTQVPKGTVIGSTGGGNWESTDGKIKTHIAALLDTPDFDKVQNPTWPKTVELTKEIEKWSRNTRDLIQNDPANAEKIISLRVKKIEDIRKMIK
jgi:hypothetical protein